MLVGDRETLLYSCLLQDSRIEDMVRQVSSPDERIFECTDIMGTIVESFF